MATPNILLISTDQQRWDTCGPAKPGFLRTPHLDWLSADGISFDRAYADCPVCVPSRAALMTGKTCLSHGMGHNARSSQYFGSEGTLPTALRALGYQTLAIGKPHFDPQRHRHGFDETITLDDYQRAMARSGSPLQPRRHGLGENEIVATMATVPEALTTTSWITERAVDFLCHRRDPSAPWLLWVSYSKPHPPLDPPEPYYSMYRDSPIPAPIVSDWSRRADAPTTVRRKRWGASCDRMDPEQLRAAKAAYYGLITQIDFCLGRIFAAIWDTGTHERYTLRDDTLVIFCSDHGEMLADHGMPAKGEFYESSARVPMILRLPGAWKRRHRGERSSALACLGDILPTVLAACGQDAPAGSDCIDLLGMHRGERAARGLLLGAQGFSPSTEHYEWVGAIDGSWKYIHYHQGGREQLFDLAGDPQETRDLAAEPAAAAQLERMRGELIRELARRHGGRFLDQGRLRTAPEPVLDEQELRLTGFQGFMRDDHLNDVQH